MERKTEQAAEVESAAREARRGREGKEGTERRGKTMAPLVWISEPLLGNNFSFPVFFGGVVFFTTPFTGNYMNRIVTAAKRVQMGRF